MQKRKKTSPTNVLLTQTHRFPFLILPKTQAYIVTNAANARFIVGVLSTSSYIHSLCSIQIVKSTKLISEILSSTFLIDHRAASGYLPILVNVLNGVTEFADEYKEPKFDRVAMLLTESKAYRVYGPNSTSNLLEDIEGTETNATVIVDVQDVLMKNDTFCGPAGSMTMAAVVDKLSASDSVSTIIFDMDCPGGSVAGTQTYAQAIKNSPKRTIAFVNEGIAASGGYWLGASCDEFYCSQSTDMVGSIGVMATLRDYSERLAKLGVKEIVINSRLSEDKNKEVHDALHGDTDAIQNRLDFIAEKFISYVKENRTIYTSVADPFKGAMYFAEEAKAIGLIDGIKSWDELMTEVSSSKSSNTKNVIKTNSEMKISEKIAILNDPASTVEAKATASAAIQSAFDADEVITTAEVDTAVAAATAGLQTAEEVDTAIATAVADLETSVTSITEENAELKTQLTAATGIIEEEDDDEKQFGNKKLFKPTVTL